MKYIVVNDELCEMCFYHTIKALDMPAKEIAHCQKIKKK